MIVNDKDAIARLTSPMNLINRLKDTKKNNAMSLFGIGRKKEVFPAVSSNGSELTEHPVENTHIVFNPFQTPEIPLLQTEPTKLNDILENHESQIKLGLAHDKA